VCSSDLAAAVVVSAAVAAAVAVAERAADSKASAAGVAASVADRAAVAVTGRLPEGWHEGCTLRSHTAQAGQGVV